MKPCAASNGLLFVFLPLFFSSSPPSPPSRSSEGRHTFFLIKGITTCFFLSCFFLFFVFVFFFEEVKESAGKGM